MCVPNETGMHICEQFCVQLQKLTVTVTQSS